MKGTPGSIVDRAQVRRYVRNFERNRGSFISWKELAEFDALTPTQVALLLHGVPPARAGAVGRVFSTMLGYAATGAANFRLGCSALAFSSSSLVGLGQKWPPGPRATPPR
jgi:hypothetical protein